MKNSILSLLFGVLIGGILVYFLKPVGGGIKSQNQSFLSNTPLKEARDKIANLYTKLNNAKDKKEVTDLFRRSYVLPISDIKNLLIAHEDADSIRIYPALSLDKFKNIDMLSFVVLLEDKKGNIILNKNPDPSVPQVEIQDQWGPCPKNCPTSDFYTNWDTINFPNLK